MSTAPVKTIPQPLTSTEIKKGIAVRMTADLPLEIAEPLRDAIVASLGKTCSLNPNFAYAKFKGKWTLGLASDAINTAANWWVDYELDDFGRVTKGGIGGSAVLTPTHRLTEKFEGVIEEVPPDRFRRETDQPIPKPTELKAPELEKSTFSRSTRGGGNRRRV